LNNAQFINNEPGFQLLESIRLEYGVYHLLNRHLERLKRSGDYFNFTIPMSKIREELDNYAQMNRSDIQKVRLLVSKEERITVEGSTIHSLNGPLPVKLARSPISNKNRFLYHKTTNREVYHRHVEDSNVFDTLLWNQAGELTEFTNGNLVVKSDGKLWTPFSACGLLNGTYREELLYGGKIEERIILKKDLKNAEQLWFINSVRGWIQVYLE
jgi:para-aminobenzoate synthetase/4-amino-4-deoxychorismate lyase